MGSRLNRLTSRGAVVLGLGISLAAAGVLLGVPDLTRAGALLLVLPLLARLLVSRPFGLVTSRTVDPPKVTTGTPASVHLVLRNTGRTTSPLLVAEDQVTYALGDRPRMLVARLAPGEEREVQYRVRSHVRGRHPVGPLSVRVTDAFGMAHREVVVPGTDSVLVLPRTVPLRGTPVMRAGSGGDESSSHQLALHGESDVGVREYRSGDELRRIHWPSTARTGQMMVRQDEQPGRRRALVLLDNRASSHAGTGGGGSLEWSVSATASVATHLVAHGLETYLATADETNEPLAPLGGVDDALEALAVVATCSRTGPDGLVDAATEVAASGGGTVVAVVGPLDHEQAQRLTRTGHGIAFVVDPDSFEQAGERPSATAAALTAGGWRAVDVQPGSRIAEVWDHLVAARAGAA